MISRTTTRKMKFTCPQCASAFEETIDVPDFLAGSITLTTALCPECHRKMVEFQERTAAEQTWARRAEAAGIPPERVNWDKTRGNVPLMRFIWNNRRKTIAIGDHYDTGKTWAVCGALCAMIRQDPAIRVKFWNFNDLATHYSALLTESIHEAERFLAQLTDYDVLAIDDIGKKRLSFTVGDLLYTVANRVYERRGGALWITYNRSPGQLIDKFENQDAGEAFFSRIKRMINDGSAVSWKQHKIEA